MKKNLDQGDYSSFKINVRYYDEEGPLQPDRASLFEELPLLAKRFVDKCVNLTVFVGCAAHTGSSRIKEFTQRKQGKARGYTPVARYLLFYHLCKLLDAYRLRKDLRKGPKLLLYSLTVKAISVAAAAVIIVLVRIDRNPTTAERTIATRFPTVSMYRNQCRCAAVTENAILLE